MQVNLDKGDQNDCVCLLVLLLWPCLDLEPLRIAAMQQELAASRSR